MFELQLDKVEEGEIISSTISVLERPLTEHFEKTGVTIDNERDERDELVEYTELEKLQDETNRIQESNRTRSINIFLAESTKWIYAANLNKPIRSPNDRAFLIRTIYSELGQLNSIMREMNWHISCKKELMRWIRKMGLSDDLLIARQGIVDESEELVKNSVRTGDVDTAKFVLKTAGKGRGWSEKEDNAGKGDVYAFITIGKDSVMDMSKMSDGELTALLESKLKGENN
jgi:hypothetical protein